MNLHEFLLADLPVDEVMTVPLVVERQGKVHDLEIKVKPISNDLMADYRKRAMRPNPVKGQPPIVDSAKLQEYMVINHTVEPNFKDDAAIKAAGCVTPMQYLSKKFKAGEIDKIQLAIMDASGFQDIEELREEAKN